MGIKEISLLNLSSEEKPAVVVETYPSPFGSSTALPAPVAGSMIIPLVWA